MGHGRRPLPRTVGPEVMKIRLAACARAATPLSDHLPALALCRLLHWQLRIPRFPHRQQLGQRLRQVFQGGFVGEGDGQARLAGRVFVKPQ